MIIYPGMPKENYKRLWPVCRVWPFRGLGRAANRLALERAGRLRLVECKLSKAPKPSRGFHELVNHLQPESACVIAPVDQPYEIKKGIQVCNLEHWEHSRQ